MYNQFTYFWKTESPFSQWHPSEFSDNHYTYCNAEQYMMAKKALLFKDQEVYQKIMNTQNARTIKDLGRKIRNFDLQLWDMNKIQIVYQGNFFKFSQNETLKEKLIQTEGTFLVEASPYDSIWGIGLKEGDTGYDNMRTWKGKNLLGFILTNLRDSVFL